MSATRDPSRSAPASAPPAAHLGPTGAARRRVLGQHMTPPDVADVVLAFALRRPGASVLDPSCGDGVFLARALARLRHLGDEEEVRGAPAPRVHGVEIDPATARLAEGRLRRFDREAARGRIVVGDFFDERVAGALPAAFDAVVGNPPYVRAEAIGAFAPDRRRYRETLRERIAMELADACRERPSGRAGLHGYFLLRATRYLREGGKLGLVLFDTWLDAAHGDALRAFVLEHYRIEAVVVSRVERWFVEAGANTCLLLLERCAERAARAAHPARFVELRAPLAELLSPVGGGARAPGVATFRHRALEALRAAVLGSGGGLAEGALRGVTVEQRALEPVGAPARARPPAGRTPPWGSHLRAPRALLRALELARDALVPLGDVAAVTRGFTTGADPWFYVREIAPEGGPRAASRAADAAGEPLRRVRSGDGSVWWIEARFLAPVVRNPDRLLRLGVAPRELPDRVVLAQGPLDGTLLQDYVEHGARVEYALGKGRRAVPARSRTCAARRRWYELPTHRPARVLFQKALDRRHGHYLADAPVHCNQRFYTVEPRAGLDDVALAAALNNVLVALQIEVQRAAHGLGAVEATVDDARRLLVVDPTRVAPAARREIERALAALAGRPLGSVFEELGAGQGTGAARSPAREDRRRLDRALLCTAARFDDALLDELHRTLVELVAARLERAGARGRPSPDEA